MAIEKTTTQNGVRTFHTAGKYCADDIVVTTAVSAPAPTTETKTVALDMASGDQVITKSSNVDGMTQVTVQKPATMLAENIKKDVVIGGVTGTYEGGGGGDSGGEFLVQVVDYDGTVLKQDHLDTGDTFTLPNAPTHSRLTFQEWSSPVVITNNTVTVGDSDIIIGAVYTTVSGYSEFDIEVEKPMETTSISFKMGATSGTTVDWGDGTITTDGTTTHTYDNYGEYTIKCNATTVPSYIVGNTSTAGTNIENANCRLKRAFLAGGVTAIDASAFRICRSLVAITIPNTVTTIGEYAFYGSSLISIAIPDGVTTINQYAIVYMYAIKYVCLPRSITDIANNAVYNLPSVKNITIPEQVSTIGNNCFCNSSSIERLTFPSSIVSIGENTFGYACQNLKHIKFSVTNQSASIYRTILSMCYLPLIVDFSGSSVIPALRGAANASYFNKLSKIVIPDALYNDWCDATNWISLKRWMYKASEVQ